MKKILLSIFLFPLLAVCQQKDSTVPIGTTIGNQVVIPVAVAAAGYAPAQALIYYPDDYFLAKNVNKKYPLFVFLHGAGEGTKLSAGEVTNTSLPYLIKNGLKPYGIDKPTGDTVKFIVVSPHCALCGGSYSYPQLKYTLPYLIANYHVDTSCIWFGGLSSGGRGTWSMFMGDAGNPSQKDTATTMRLTGIMPMANGGYDNAINTPINRANLDSTMKRGGALLYVIGDQDPGYNAIGYDAYWAEVNKYGQKSRLYTKVIVGGTHSTNVWNTPFPLSAVLWDTLTKMNSWSLMWALRKNAVVVPPPVVPKAKAYISVDSAVIHYPTTWITLTDTSINAGGGGSWDIIDYPPGPRPTISSIDFHHAYYFGLRPGTYTFGIHVYGLAGNLATTVNNADKTQTTTFDFNNMDSATVKVTVYGPPACPVCPPPVVCPICPPIRKAVGFTIDAITGLFKFTYDDGNP